MVSCCCPCRQPSKLALYSDFVALVEGKLKFFIRNVCTEAASLRNITADSEGFSQQRKLGWGSWNWPCSVTGFCSGYWEELLSFEGCCFHCSDVLLIWETQLFLLPSLCFLGYVRPWIFHTQHQEERTSSCRSLCGAQTLLLYKSQTMWHIHLNYAIIWEDSSIKVF